jgi:hypothetical protein
MESNIDIIKSDAGVRTVYDRGTMQMPMRMRFALLTEAEFYIIRAWKETVKGANWFTLQDQNVGIKPAIQAKAGSTSSIIVNTVAGSGLANADWPTRSPGLWCIFNTSAGLAGKRRRIIAHSSGAIQVNPAFSAAPAVDDTFFIGLPVFLTNNPMPRRIPPSWWEVEFVFEELGYVN